MAAFAHETPKGSEQSASEAMAAEGVALLDVEAMASTEQSLV